MPFAPLVNSMYSGLVLLLSLMIFAQGWTLVMQCLKRFLELGEYSYSPNPSVEDKLDDTADSNEGIRCPDLSEGARVGEAQVSGHNILSATAADRAMCVHSRTLPPRILSP